MDSIMSLLMMLTMSTLTPLMTIVVNELMTTIKQFATRVYDSMNNEYKVSVVCELGRQSSTYDNHQIDAVLLFLSNNDMVSNTYACQLMARGKDSYATVGDRLRNLVSVPMPKSVIHYNGMRINFYETCGKTSKDEVTVRQELVICGKDRKTITLFMASCLEKYRDEIYPIKNELRYFCMHKADGLYSEVPLCNTETTFDDIFFPQKNLVIDLADKIKNGKLKKLSLLLHGEPGCGKTSIIRALGSYLNYSIVEIKLSNIQSESGLMEIFFEHLKIVSGKHDSRVDKSKCIYVFEDIDAHGTQVHSRGEKSPQDDLLENMKSTAIKNASKLFKSGISLASILNALDGIMELRGVVVMTTNHIEKLDPALIRPGRVTRRIELKRMTSVDAYDYIESCFGKHDVHVEDYKYTPADIASLCQTSLGIDELKKYLMEYDSSIVMTADTAEITPVIMSTPSSVAISNDGWDELSDLSSIDTQDCHSENNDDIPNDDASNEPEKNTIKLDMEQITRSVAETNRQSLLARYGATADLNDPELQRMEVQRRMEQDKEFMRIAERLQMGVDRDALISIVSKRDYAEEVRRDANGWNGISDAYSYMHWMKKDT